MDFIVEKCTVDSMESTAYCNNGCNTVIDAVRSALFDSVICYHCPGCAIWTHTTRNRPVPIQVIDNEHLVNVFFFFFGFGGSWTKFAAYLATNSSTVVADGIRMKVVHVSFVYLSLLVVLWVTSPVGDTSHPENTRPSLDITMYNNPRESMMIFSSCWYICPLRLARVGDKGLPEKEWEVWQ